MTAISFRPDTLLLHIPGNYVQLCDHQRCSLTELLWKNLWCINSLGYFFVCVLHTFWLTSLKSAVASNLVAIMVYWAGKAEYWKNLPMWPGFDSWTWHHVRIEFVIGSCPNASRAFLQVIPPPTKTNTFWFNLIENPRARGLSVARLLNATLIKKKLIRLFFFFFFFYLTSPVLWFHTVIIASTNNRHRFSLRYLDIKACLFLISLVIFKIVIIILQMHHWYWSFPTSDLYLNSRYNIDH